MPSDDSREDIIDRSALRDTSELEHLRQLVSEHESAIINRLKGELWAVPETISDCRSHVLRMKGGPVKLQR